MAYTFIGCGTTFYGERDFRMDGSYVTTEWMTFFYLPVVPLRSIRVVETSSDSTYLVVYFSSKTSYAVLEETKPNLRQVVSTYAYLVGWLALAMVFEQVRRSLRFDDVYAWLWILPYAATPTGLRIVAKRQMARDWDAKVQATAAEMFAGAVAEAPAVEPGPPSPSPQTIEAPLLHRTGFVPVIDGIELDPAKLVPPRALTDDETRRAMQESLKQTVDRYRALAGATAPVDEKRLSDAIDRLTDDVLANRVAWAERLREYTVHEEVEFVNIDSGPDNDNRRGREHDNGEELR